MSRRILPICAAPFRNMPVRMGLTKACSRLCSGNSFCRHVPDITFVRRAGFGGFHLVRPYRSTLCGVFQPFDNFLLIDEPTNHLDSGARESVAAYLKKKKGFILVNQTVQMIKSSRHIHIYPAEGSGRLFFLFRFCQQSPASSKALHGTRQPEGLKRRHRAESLLPLYAFRLKAGFCYIWITFPLFPLSALARRRKAVLYCQHPTFLSPHFTAMKGVDALCQ